MTEKILLPFYTVFSTLIYVVTLAGILAIPLLFTTQAEAPLDFVLEDISVAPADAADAVFAASGNAPQGWYRIDYRMNVGSAKLSPYSYTVETFALKAPAEFKKAGAYFLALDEPLSFDRSQRDAFTLSLYVTGFADEAAVNEFARTAGFGTRGIVRSFSFFKEEIAMFAPGFFVEELI
ncbi:MAG: hypothetical protein IJK89_06010 [Clostridia bacterium]|nr:hypothetical protein [Clostridia bacterium]